MNLNALKKSIDKLKKKEAPKYISIMVCLLSFGMFIFVLFLNEKIIDYNKALTLVFSEISMIRSECIEPYEREEGKFKLAVTKSEENVVTVSWKTLFLIADSYSYSFIPTGICSN